MAPSPGGRSASSILHPVRKPIDPLCKRLHVPGEGAGLLQRIIRSRSLACSLRDVRRAASRGGLSGRRASRGGERGTPGTHRTDKDRAEPDPRKGSRMRRWSGRLLLTLSFIGLVALLDCSSAWAMGSGGGGRRHGASSGGGNSGSSDGGSSHSGSSHGGSVATPEPLTMLAVGSGLAGTAAYRYLRRRKK
jgi:hypothetical protein